MREAAVEDVGFAGWTGWMMMMFGMLMLMMRRWRMRARTTNYKQDGREAARGGKGRARDVTACLGVWRKPRLEGKEGCLVAVV